MVKSERDVVAEARFPTSIRSKPTTVLTGTKSLRTDDGLPIGYLLLAFQLIWNNFKIEIFQLQMGLNPYEFWHDITGIEFLPTHTVDYSLADFQLTWRNFCDPPREHSWSCFFHSKKLLKNQLYYRFNTIRVLTQNMKLWQMIAYR